ncbi:hypothetical protein [Asaia sp. VD9]|uniref:hypothetical protein n=1 Tax=Asaia sp. VD9 TaxID=3081235 RepID=UPI003015F0A2
MNRTLGFLLGVTLLASPVAAFAQHAPGGPSGHYADGTGNSMIDSLNAAQLNDNYRGPYYTPGQAPPPFQPVQLAPHAPPPPPSPPAHHIRHHAHPQAPMPDSPLPPPSPR